MNTGTITDIVNFIYMDELSFISLYKSMVRPHLEYAHSVWCPYKTVSYTHLTLPTKRIV